jgi:predicted phosphate transport protein (TIGR00153 family)
MKMNINAIISIFTPKEGKFFPLLNEMAAILDSSATLLHALFTSSDDDTKTQLSRQIKDEELKGDKLMKKIFKELNNTFITPFDREDISSLADEIDDAIDAINRSAQKVVLYTPEELPASTKQLTEIIKSETEEVRRAVGELDKLRKSGTAIRGCTKKIKKLEEDADAVYEKGITELFHCNIKTLELIKLKEIIQELERSANIINTVGKAIKTIIVKYA